MPRPSPKIATGTRFGLLVIKQTLKVGARTKFLCTCDCGTEKVLNFNDLIRRQKPSCGCRRVGNPTHGLLRIAPREYFAWSAMKGRCYSKTGREYKLYGGRGIRVCARWLDGFDSFLTDMGMRPSTKHSIERLENEGDYTPSNCIWGTKTQQARNRRTTRRVSFRGKSMSLAEAADISGVPYSTALYRDAAGYPIEISLREKKNVR